MKRLLSLGFGALFASMVIAGCGGTEGGGGGNPDAAKVIGTTPEDPKYGEASSNLMNKMHGGAMDATKKPAAAPAETK